MTPTWTALPAIIPSASPPDPAPTLPQPTQTMPSATQPAPTPTLGQGTGGRIAWPRDNQQINSLALDDRYVYFSAGPGPILRQTLDQNQPLQLEEFAPIQYPSANVDGSLRVMPRLLKEHWLYYVDVGDGTATPLWTLRAKNTQTLAQKVVITGNTCLIDFSVDGDTLAWIETETEPSGSGQERQYLGDSQIKTIQLSSGLVTVLGRSPAASGDIWLKIAVSGNRLASLQGSNRNSTEGKTLLFDLTTGKSELLPSGALGSGTKTCLRDIALAGPWLACSVSATKTALYNFETRQTQSFEELFETEMGRNAEKIEGEWLVWSGHTQGNLYNLAQGKLVPVLPTTERPAYFFEVAISGPTVAWIALEAYAYVIHWQEIPYPTLEPLRVPPPGATLTVNGQTQAAGIGAYCWTTTTGDAVTTACAKLDGVPTAREPLVIVEAATFNAHFQLENLTPPDSLLLSLAPVTPAREIPSADAGHRIWQSGEGWGWAAGLPLKTGIDYPFQAGEFVNGDGLYLAELHAHWNQSGDVTYGFLMQIGVGSSGLSAQLPTLSAGTGPALASLALQKLSPLARLGKGSASALALSPDGRKLGVVTPLGVYLFDTELHKEIWYRAFENRATLLAFSPDSSWLAVGSRASILSILDADTGKTLVQIAGEEYIHAVWSPDGAKLLVSGGCQAIGIWDSKNGTLLHALVPAHCNNVTPGIVDAVWSADGKRIYSGVSAWDAQTYQRLVNYSPQMPEFILGYAMVPSPTGNLLAVGNGRVVAILNGETGLLKQTLTPEPRASMSFGNIAWSPDGVELAAGDFDGQSVWNVETGQLTASLKGFRARAGLAWLPDGKTLVGLFTPEGGLAAVDAASGKILFSLDGFDATNPYPGNPGYPKWDGNFLFTTDGTNLIRWNALTGEVVSRMPAPAVPDFSSGFGGDIVLSPDGKRAAAGASVMDAISGQELAHIERNLSRGWDKVAWSPDGQRIVSGDSLGMDPPVVWDAQSGKVLLTLQLEAGGTSPYLGGLAWSPDGSLIIGGGSLMGPSGMNNGLLMLWDANTGKQLRLLSDGMTGQRINTLAWSPDGKWLAAGLSGSQIILWDMRQYRPLAVLAGHMDQVVGLNWSADGALLASNAIDGTVLIWKMP